MLKKVCTAVALTMCLSANLHAGMIQYGADSYDQKTPTTDPHHEDLAVPLVAEGSICFVVAPSDEFVDGIGDADNSSYAIDVGTLVSATGPIAITDIGWDVEISTIGASWRSEASFAFSTDTDPNAVQPISLAPGFGDDSSGTTFYSSGGLVNLNGAGLENLIAVDGILNLELFEGFDDVADTADSLLLSGSSLTISVLDILTFTTETVELKWVPEPSSLSLLGLSCVSLLGFRRKY